MGLKLVTPPASEPVTLAEIKAQCRVDTDFTADDAILTSMGKGARLRAERQCERSFVATTWRYYFDYLGCSIRLPVSPLISVAGVHYTDTAGVLQLLDSSLYTVSVARSQPWIFPTYQTYWPYSRCYPESAYVEFVAGFGADASFVPEDIKQAIKLIVEYWYENRGEDEKPDDIPKAALSLLNGNWNGDYS